MSTQQVTRWMIALGMAAWLTSGATALGQESTAKPKRLQIPMSDGVHLATYVYIPDNGETFPTILVRSPYGGFAMQWIVEPMTSAGYAVVIQDVRGMNGSDGVFIPFVNERKDGLVTLDWVAKQPWCNGKIGMWGSSYLAYCALAIAPDEHPALTAIVNLSGFDDPQAMSWPGGALHLMVALPWTLSAQISGSSKRIDWADAFMRLPVVDIPESLGFDSPAWKGSMQAFRSVQTEGTSGDAGRLGRIKIPVLHMTGWNDFIGRYALDVYEGIKSAPRGSQKLIVGPWRHDQIWQKETKVGDVDFGPDAAMGAGKVVQMSIRWFDRWMKPADKTAKRSKPVELFVMGTNKWRKFSTWPPKKTEYQKWYLHSKGSARTSEGKGKLSLKKSAKSGRDTFVYDPADPVPTVGGANFHFFPDNLGPKDQRKVEQREDVLVYTTPPMSKNVDIIGPLSAVIYASSEGKNTDFTVKLVEVRPDGYARIIEDGIRRGPDPISSKPVTTMVSNDVYRFTIDLGATAIRIRKGHRLRVEVSSSSFPKYSRNLNTGEPAESGAEFKAVTQTVFHSKSHPSHIVLPVLQKR